MFTNKWILVLACSLAVCASAYSDDQSYSAGVLDTITGVTYQPTAQDDTDFNGIRDNPFVTLPGVAEIWLATSWNDDFTKVRTVIAERWNGAVRNNEPTFVIDVDVQRANDTLQRITLEVPYALAWPGGSAVLLVVVASDLEILLGPIEAEKIGQLPNGFIVS